MSRGRKPGATKTGGRVAGVPNKATRDLKGIAQQYTNEALQALVKIVRNPESPPAAIVGAANAILDRGHGKPAQTIDATHRTAAATEMSYDELLDIARGGRAGMPVASGRATEPRQVH